MMKFLRWAAPRRESLPGYSPNSSGRYEIQFAKVREIACGCQGCPAKRPRSLLEVPRGAALLTKSGKVYTGVQCRECQLRTQPIAPSVLRRQGPSAKGIASSRRLLSSPSAALSPCGACRQVLAEFGECVVICADSRNTRRLRIHLLSEFTSPHLQAVD